MTTLTLAARDSATMTRRSLRHVMRYPVTLVVSVVVPVMLLLLFTGVFGSLRSSLGAVSHSAYLAYVVPGIIVMTAAYGSSVTAQSINRDSTEGIIARFRTMAIFRPSVLTGHVLGSMIQTVIALAAVVGVGLLVGFRPTATPFEWLAATGVLLMITFATTWFSVACGLVAKSAESASNMPMPLTLLPFLGSGFVPTDNMPSAVAWFADYQPFTPVIETLRGLLLGTGIGHNGLLAVAWSVAIAAGCFLWSRRLYGRDPAN